MTTRRIPIVFVFIILTYFMFEWTCPVQADVADPNQELHHAVKGANLKEVRRLLAKGADLKWRDAQGETHLYLATLNGYTEIVEALLAANADPNQSCQGNHPLLMASWLGRSAIVKLLLKHGAKVDLASRNGFTPLMAASREDRPDVVSILLSAGAKVNQASDSGSTALFVASSTGHGDVVKRLLEAGADPSILNKQGLSARQAAQAQGYTQIPGLLADAHSPQTQSSRKPQPSANAPSPEKASSAPNEGFDPNKHQLSGITYPQFYNEFVSKASTATSSQRDASWQNFEGKWVKWSGKVTDVSEGWFGARHIYVDMGTSPVTRRDLFLTIAKQDKEAALRLKKGEVITFIGRLSGRSGSITSTRLNDVILVR